MFKLYQARAVVVGHRGGGQVHCTIRLQKATAWLSRFFEVVGDKMPDGSIHMPFLLKWTHLHLVYMDEVQLAYHFKAFKALIRLQFSRVCYYPV